jgi:hypothetical protein
VAAALRRALILELDGGQGLSVHRTKAEFLVFLLLWVIRKGKRPIIVLVSSTGFTMGTPDQLRHAGVLAITTIGFPGTMAAMSWIEDILRN